MVDLIQGESSCAQAIIQVYIHYIYIYSYVYIYIVYHSTQYDREQVCRLRHYATSVCDHSMLTYRMLLSQQLGVRGVVRAAAYAPQRIRLMPPQRPASSLVCRMQYLSSTSCVRDTHTSMSSPIADSVHARESTTGQQNTRSMAAEPTTAQSVGEPYDPWKVLGLAPGVSAQVIRSRYHELMRSVHPHLCEDKVGDVDKMNAINKAYELITSSPTLDKRYRNLVSDTQYVYYRFLPDWVARNVDEMPRYWSWLRWRVPGGFQVFLLLCACYALGRFYAAMPMLTTVFLISVCVDILLHTMTAPATLSMLFLYSVLCYRSYDMAWLTSPKTFLRRELGY